jgi:hypothetical protein
MTGTLGWAKAAFDHGVHARISFSVGVEELMHFYSTEVPATLAGPKRASATL